MLDGEIVGVLDGANEVGLTVGNFEGKLEVGTAVAGFFLEGTALAVDLTVG